MPVAAVDMPAESVGEEISHLMKDRGYPQKRAVGAAMNMRRAGKFGRKGMKKRKKARKSYR